MRKIMQHHLRLADAEIAKGEAGNPAVVSAAYAEARLTAVALAQFESPKLTPSRSARSRRRS
jgi:hypothetical protein